MHSKKILSILLFLALCPVLSRAQTDSDISFDTIAMTYPMGKKVKIPIIGTERFAKNIKGEATIERRKSVTLIQIDLGRLPPPSQLGPAFTTYVVWAITPEGTADNLGEYRQRGSETLDNWFGSELSTSTPHRTFSLIITAEPHYLVSSPSRLVVVANQGGREAGLVGQPNRISFSGDSDFERVLVSPEPAAARKDKDYPIELLQARRALDLARYYESENYAQAIFEKARSAFESAERLYQNNQRDEARESAQLAIRLGESARKLSVSKRKAREQRDLIAEKDELLTRLEDEARKRSQESSALQAQLDDEKRRRRALEQENERLLKDVDLARRETGIEKEAREMEKGLYGQLRRENEQLREQLERAQARANVAEQNQQLREQRDSVLRQFETRREARGTVIVLPDNIFEGETSTAISAEGSFKLEALSGLLAKINNNLVIESYTDNRGTQDARFKFTQARAQTLATHLNARGVSTDRIQTFGNGGSNPRQDNRTPQGRAANRRIELIIVESNTPGAN